MLTSDYEQAARDQGLAAGLGLALADCDIPATAPGRYAAVPARLADGGRPVLTNSLAGREDIVFMDCGLVRSRPPAAASTGELAAAISRRRDLAAVGRRLAAVRLGLTRRLLDGAVDHLASRTGGAEPLIRKQMLVGTIADVIAGVELLRALAPPRPARTVPADAVPADGVLADLHARITELDWQVIRLFGAAGYIADHPVRALYVSALVANTWVVGGGQS
jgi:alkylation response protein AidB-like acyl-CoA dehydrogenase